ncbi:cytochrome d ubiquinol oxidase subunit II [Citricoccus nitrophenolicus]|uniref:Cytochrome d ubiquinol oxidase subunit II n=1 Tax=Citricoccus nitrophenolicus TaxID=863575 RepID=A0ABV0IL64_9MICC|nr:cytochrome d ubiquinol oxidase subunit II [Citricoccus sp. I39-566]WMY77581.1 cytochrome d ubiquinol oxidase subunit II [Citricoccus sp. I39-566]
MTPEMTTEFLPTLWFALVAVLWTGYLFLDGFDLGVGMLMRGWARNESRRRVLLNTIGPVWDGNEVWLITAAGATFAAFPLWYAALFAGLYIPLTVALLALILRAVSIEYRGKSRTARTRDVWDWCLAGGSAVAAFSVGLLLAVCTTGLPLNANGDRVGGPFAWLTGEGILGGFAVVGFALAMGWAYLGLKTDGAPRQAAHRHLTRWLPLYLLPMGAWAVVVVSRDGGLIPWALLAMALGAALGAWTAARSRREGWTFVALGASLVAGAAGIFLAVFPVVLPSTLDPAFHLTAQNASSSPYTLTVMSWVAVVFVPLILAYSAYVYWVFRRRLAETHIPESHVVTPL